MLQVDQNNYPEMLGKTAIINAGAVINFVFPLVKPFLDKRTQNKIEVRGCLIRFCQGWHSPPEAVLETDSGAAQHNRLAAQRTC